jgi:hypothetical protein
MHNGLLRCNPDVAIVAVLRCYSNVLRRPRTGALTVGSGSARSEIANRGIRGIAHCLRWISACCPQRIVVSTPPSDVIEAEAHKLLAWGVKYDALCNHHTAYSRKINGKRLVEASWDAVGKTITFMPWSNFNPQFLVSQVDAQTVEFAKNTIAYPDEKLSELSKAWFTSSSHWNGTFQYDDVTIASSGALQIVIDWLTKTCLPELADDYQLGDFSFGNLRRVLAALNVAAVFRIRIEDVLDDERNADRVVSHVLSFDRSMFIQWLQNITTVPSAEISAIVSLLTFDTERDRVTLAHQPLVLDCHNQIHFSPRLFIGLTLSHTFIGAINLSTAGKSRYAAVTETIAASIVQMTAEQIHCGCLGLGKLVIDKKFVLPDGRKIKPDVVLLSANGEELLVIDVKNATPPFGITDIHNDIDELENKWKPQIQKYLAAFRQSPDILSQQLNNYASAPKAVLGMIVLRWPFAIPAEFENGLCAIDLPTLRANLLGGDPNRSFQELYEWTRDRPDVPKANRITWKQKEIPVNDWTYRYSVLEIK